MIREEFLYCVKAAGYAGGGAAPGRACGLRPVPPYAAHRMADRLRGAAEFKRGIGRRRPSKTGICARGQPGWSVSAGFPAVSDPAWARALGSRRTLSRLATVVTPNTKTMTARLRLVLISGTLPLRPCP